MLTSVRVDHLELGSAGLSVIERMLSHVGPHEARDGRSKSGDIIEFRALVCAILGFRHASLAMKSDVASIFSSLVPPLYTSQKAEKRASYRLAQLWPMEGTYEAC